jgi:glycopeptide antibiotics resistance protein
MNEDENPAPTLKRAYLWGCGLLVLITAAWVLSITLRPIRGGPADTLNLIPFSKHILGLLCLLGQNCYAPGRTLRFLLIDILGNIVVFVPLGFGLAGLWWGGRGLPQVILRVALSGFALSLFIELVQLSIPSRVTDVTDLILNTVGVILGALAFGLVMQMRRRLQAEGITSL